MSITATFTQKGIIILYEPLLKLIGEHNMNKIFKKLTISKTKKMGNKFTTRSETYYRLVRVGEKMFLILARFTLDDVIPIAPLISVNKISPGEPIDSMLLEPGPTLDFDQQLTMNHIMENVYNPKKAMDGTAGCVVVMGTGKGKSYLSSALIGEIGLKTLIIAPSEIVMQETKKALIASYPDLTLGVYSGNEKSDGDVVLMIINSAISDEFTFKKKVGRKIEITTEKHYNFLKRFGLIIYDEIHNYTSSQRQEIFWRANCKYALGLTATPNENPWGFDIVFQKHVGPLIDASELPGYGQGQDSVGLWLGKIFPIEYHGPPKYTQKLVNPSTQWTSYGLMVEQFASDPYRCEMLMDLFKNLWKRNRNTFVFVATRNFATKLATMFKEVNGSDSIEESTTNDAVVLMGGSTTKDIIAANQSSLIFVTYGFGWQGISIAKMDTIVFAIPRMAKMRQILGRIIRKSGDITIEREIYDIVDAETELGEKEFKGRVKIYKETKIYNFEIMDRIVEDRSKRSDMD